MHSSAPPAAPPRRRPSRALGLTTAVAVLLGGLSLLGLSPAAAADTLLSQRKAATASSVENADYTRASAAFDGSSTTRWSSAAADDQWLAVDLGATASISSVVLTWEAAHARAYRIETSDDGRTWTPVHSTTAGRGGTETVPLAASGRHVRMFGLTRATAYGFSLFEMKVYGTLADAPAHHPTQPFAPNLDPGESITVTGPTVVPSTATPPTEGVTHREFQANCSATHTRSDDPIVAPGLSGGSHSHTFLGNRTTDARSTTGSLTAGATSCSVPGDASAYWFPTLYDGDQVVTPVGEQVIYYKSGVTDYRSVRPFPKGLRYVVGDPAASQVQFQQAAGAVEGWECGDDVFNWDFPAYCEPGTQLNVRYQAPSCWDGVNLDVADHKSHMAYPEDGRCTASHPVAVPMIEFKTAFPVSGDMSEVRLASGRGYSWHYDFFNAWDAPVLDALVRHCINGGLQCNPYGYDLYKPARGSALDANGRPAV